MYLSIILLLLLLINVGMGITATYRTTTLQQYAIGSKGFSTAGIVKSILTISYISGIFYYPLSRSSLIIYTGIAISCFVIGNLLSRQLQLFLHNYSVAEIMGNLYGKNIRIIVALCGLVHNVGVISISLKLLSKVSKLCGIEEPYSFLIAFLFILFNDEVSNIKPSTLWGVIRCATFTLLLPIIAFVLWEKFTDQCNNEQYLIGLSLKEAWHTVMATPLAAGWEYMLLLIVHIVPNLNPTQVQRILISANATQIKRSFNAAGFFLLSINLFLLWIVLLITGTYGTKRLIELPLEVFNNYVGLKALFIIGIVALATAMGGASLNTATVLIVHDLKNCFQCSSKQSEVHGSRYLFVGCAFVVNVIAMLITLDDGSRPTRLFLFMCFRLIVSIPLFIALMGICLHPYAVRIGMLTGAIGVMMCFWILWLPDPNFVMILRLFSYFMPAHLLSLSIAQIFFKKKQQPTTDSRYRHTLALESIEILVAWKGKFIAILRQLIKCNFWDYLQKQLPKDSVPYLFFSFYIVVTGYGFFYTSANDAIWGDKLVAMVLFPSLGVATFFLVYLCFPTNSYLKKTASLLWPLSNGYFLFLVGNGILILSKFSYLPAIILIFNIYLATLITPLAVIMCSCIVTAIVLWLLRSYVCHHMIWLDDFWNLNSRVVYMILVLLVLVGTLFYHRRCLCKLLLTIQELRKGQEIHNAREFFNKQHIEALAYESKYILTELHQQFLRLLKPEETKLIHSIKQQATRLDNYFEGIFTHLKNNFYLTINWISIDQLLQECLDKIKINNLYHVPYVVLNTEQLYIQCDVERIKTLVINSLNACKLYESLDLTTRKDTFIYINDTQLGYQLTLLHGKIQKIDAVGIIITTTQQPAMLPIYRVVEMANVQILCKAKNYNTDAENQSIVNAHYGYCEIIHSDSGVTHLYVIPVNVQEVTKAFTALSPVVYTQRISLNTISMDAEAAFVKKIHEKHLDHPLLMDALQLIKTYYVTQKRQTGEPFYLHPVAVASILVDLTEDTNIIMAGLLHDVVQNTPLTEAGLTTLVGETITQIVLEVAFIDQKLPINKNDYLSYIQQLLTGNYQSALLVKLVDALHNAQTIHGHSIEKQIKKAHLIEEFYVPLAQQMGLTHIAEELHTYAVRVL